MGKNKIRITGGGIHGLPITDENPSGEYPIGYEFETDADLPPAWEGRAIVVGEKPKEGSVFLTGNGDEGEDPAVAAARKEVIQKAEAEFARRDRTHADATKALVARAEKAEAEVQHLTEQLGAANARLAAFDRDGDGKPGGANSGGDPATSEEIVSAIALLEKGNDDHWTAAGLPAVEAVAELTGKAVSRKAITEAAPDAKRPE